MQKGIVNSMKIKRFYFYFLFSISI